MFGYSLSGCYQDFEKSSLEDYVEHIKIEQIGYSVYELDHPQYFLPSQTFLDDYDYLEGGFHLYEEDTFKPEKNFPSRSLLFLRYDEDTYIKAKNCMLENIPMVGDITYTYNAYSFYRNANFYNNFTAIAPPEFPHWFTMACYNDEKCILMFIGFCANNPGIEEKYYEDTEGNWRLFINTFYGEYYDFDK